MPRKQTTTDPLASLTPEVRKQLRETYLDEATTLIDDLEAALLTLEKATDDKDVLAAAFRFAHTIKGSAAGVGFHDIVTFTHSMESALDSVRSGESRLEQAGLSALLDGIDILRKLLAATRTGAPPPDGTACLRALAASFHIEAPGGIADTIAASSTSAGSEHSLALLSRVSDEQLRDLFDEAEAGKSVFSVHFDLPGDAFTRGLDPVVLLHALGDECRIVSIVPMLDRLPVITLLDPLTCYIGFRAVVATTGTDADLQAVFEFGPEGTTLEILPISSAQLTECLASRSSDTAKDEVRGWKRLGEILVDEHLVEPEIIENALTLQRGNSDPSPVPGRGAAEEGRTIRVKQTRLDDLINLVGELVTARSALQHLLHYVEVEYGDPALSRRMKETTGMVSRAVGQLQADVLSLRMVPVRTVFQRVSRIVRDVSVRQNKLVNLELGGEDTELDKTVADALADPLIHLVRNAVDHGIETPEERKAKGKPESGQLLIVAWREGSGVVVEVRDDGAGIDRQAVIASAVRKGLIDAVSASRLSDADALDLIFASGLSTAKEVSDISGRGVGMDVVRSNISRMGGSVAVTSRSGEGTTLRLHLPLTLSVYRALIVRAGDGSYALPLDAVRATEAVDLTSCRTIHGRPMALIRGTLVGLVPLADALGLSPKRPDGADSSDEHQVVVVESGGQWIGLVVDALDPPQEIMVKPVDAFLLASGAVTGASVLGDGRIALVLDPSGVAAAALEYARSLQESKHLVAQKRS